MLGIEDYGSGSESEKEITTRPQIKLPAKNTSLSLPPPSATSKAAPVTKPKKTKKFIIGIPSLPTNAEDDNEDYLKDEKPPTKKPRLEAGAGTSSLLSILPAPKQKQPVISQPERVLGGGKGPGLVFNASRSGSTSGTGFHNDRPSELADVDLGLATETRDNESALPSTSVDFLPPSLKKGKGNISLEEGQNKGSAKSIVGMTSAPNVDFFSLSTTLADTSTPSSVTPHSISPPTISSAPSIPTFTPPEPTPQDPYPGYYLLPSGAWAAYDPEYYNTFLKKWQKEYDAHVRALEKGQDLDTQDAAEIDAAKEMEKAKREIQEREKRKALTKGAKGEPEKPRMNIDPSKLSNLAKSRHQLSSLLTDAYRNREALEEKIAEGKRNRKEAGNKYGF